MRKALLALPELVMETSQENQGPSDMLSTMELGTKEFTELGSSRRRPGWGTGRVAGCSQALLWNGTQSYRLEKAKPLRNLES